MPGRWPPGSCALSQWLLQPEAAGTCSSFLCAVNKAGAWGRGKVSCERERMEAECCCPALPIAPQSASPASTHPLFPAARAALSHFNTSFSPGTTVAVCVSPAVAPGDTGWGWQSPATQLQGLCLFQTFFPSFLAARERRAAGTPAPAPA